MIRINIFFFLACMTSILNSQTFCIQPGKDQITGIKDGYRHELWNQNSRGTACMTVGKGGLFSGNWSGILNYLSRNGLAYDQTKEHNQLGRFFTTYNCLYEPSSASGNSYLSVYGWTVNPLVEYYIIEDWRNWIPSKASDAKHLGTIEVNGGIYDIITTTRVNQPSIVGTATFPQYFSIRRATRNAGTINISDHFDKWESLGLKMGKMHEVSFVVEGYQSNGKFDFKTFEMIAKNETTGVDEKEVKKNNFYIVSEKTGGFTIISKDNEYSDAKYIVYDITGKEVRKGEITSNTEEIQNLIKGTYIVNITLDSQTYNLTASVVK
jgi:endo-1,4-beta-xylanase